MADKNETIKVTKEQIAEWKEKFGSVFSYKAKDGKVGYFCRPTRNIISASTIHAGKDALLQKATVAKNCFLGGDAELVTKDKYLFGLDDHIASMIEIVEGELKEV